MSVAADPTLAQVVPGTWTIDPTHSEVSFVARHLMVSKVKGSFKTFEGTITVGENPLQSRVEATIDTASVDTRDSTRDEHLRSPQFLDVENYPQMTYRSREVVTEGDHFLVRGDLTLHGVTKQVDLNLEVNGVITGMRGETRVGFSAQTEISRKDFGIDIQIPLDGGGVVVGDAIKIQLEIAAVLQQA